MKKVSKYHVCQPKKLGGRTLLAMKGKPHSHLHQAQKALEELRLGNTEPMAIYRMTFGELPEFVEGDRLQ